MLINISLYIFTVHSLLQRVYINILEQRTLNYFISRYTYAGDTPLITTSCNNSHVDLGGVIRYAIVHSCFHVVMMLVVSCVVVAVHQLEYCRWE